MVDTSSLFLHILAAVGMLSGGVVQVSAGARIRAARSAEQIASWARYARDAGFLILVSAVLTFMTGGHLAGAVWTTPDRSGFSYPFITVGAIALVLLAPIGPMVGGARLRRLEAAARAEADAASGAEAGGRVSTALRDQARAPGLWGPVYSLLGIGVGFVAVMTYKPGWTATTVTLLGTFLVGWLTGALAARSPR